MRCSPVSSGELSSQIGLKGFGDRLDSRLRNSETRHSAPPLLMIYGKRRPSSKDTQGSEASQAKRGRGKRSCADTLPYLQRSMLDFPLTIKQLIVIK